MTTRNYSQRLSDVLDYATSIKAGSMFADRPTVKDAMDYVHDVAKATQGGEAHVLVAVCVLLNTISRDLAEIVEGE